MRGAGLVGAAVILGIILLQVIDDGPSGSGGGTVVPPVSTTTATSTGDTTTSTTPGTANAQPRAQVRVLVLNGSNQNNVATLKRNSLIGLGYQVDPAGNTQLRQGTVVACKQGFESAAQRLSEDVGGTVTVEPFPDPPPTGRQGEDVGAGNVNCVVILGEP